MKNQKISFHKTGLFSKLICDFIDSDTELNSLINGPLNLDSIRSNLQIKNKNNRVLLSNVLKEQYNDTFFFNSDLSVVNTNISRLSNNNTYTITTGHQLSIFLSPLFLIYKITSVISYANYLNKKNKDAYFIPCFWMATEDHDFEEIKNLNLDKKYSWNLKTKDAVGNLFSDSLLNTLDEMKSFLRTTSYGKELFDVYEYVYRKNLNYADAMRSLITFFLLIMV